MLAKMSRLPIRNVKLNLVISLTHAIGMRTIIKKAATNQMFGRTPQAKEIALYQEVVV